MREEHIKHLATLLNKMKILSQRVSIHPFLFSLAPVLAAISTNIHEIELSDAYRAVGVAILVALITFICTELVLRNITLSAVFASIFILLINSYGHVYGLINNIQVGGLIIGRHRFLIPIMSASLLAMAWLLIKNRRVLGSLNQALNIVSLFAILTSTVNIVWFEFNASRRNLEESVPNERQSEIPAASPLVDYPDIYLIILDSYPREDTLENWFGLDNREFFAFLEDRGFYIADQSTSNYFGTTLTIASELNLNYIQDMDIILTDGIYPSILQDVLKDSEVRRKLETAGYQTVTFPSNYVWTDLDDADYYLTPGLTTFDQLNIRGSINQFEGLLIESSILKIVLDLDFLRTTPFGDLIAQKVDANRAVHREVLLSTFENLMTVPKIPGPKFVYAHVLSPHQPYVFSRDGSLVPEEELSARKGNPASDHNQFFIDQLMYISSRFEEVIDTIISESDPNPIIILQSDHGPDLGLDWDTPEESKLRVRMEILNTYYLPPECNKSLYKSITPVNTFRVVLNCVLGTSYTLLPDQSYYSNIRGEPRRRLDFVPVEELYE